MRRSELDPGQPVWADQRDALHDRVLAIATGVPSDPADRAHRTRSDAVTALDGLPRRVRSRARMTTRLARSLSVAGERSKDDVARSVHSIRLALREVARRAGTTAGDAALCSWVELRAAASGDRLDVDLTTRRHELATAAGQRPPTYLRTDDAAYEPRATAAPSRVLEGIAASPGQASGRAVVVVDPLQAIPDGDILVAHSTDTAWTHLFLTHDAVVTDIGDLLSHSSVVARDLGIPAVVGARTATLTIANGDHTHVNGTTGTVLPRHPLNPPPA